jgi:hypothetical protein
MITDGGKEVLSKYLLGQAPAYATHIAIGCGATPLDGNDPMPTGLNSKQTLDFEMLRIPISSRGFVEEGGQTKISLTAEIPTENRYEITEVGLWSAGRNSLARGFDSRIIFDFQENWQAHGTTISTIPFLESLGTAGDINDENKIVFQASTGDVVLQTEQRKARKEGPRFLNRSIFLRGDSSIIDGDDGAWFAVEDENFTSEHIHLNSITFDIGQNNPGDILTLAFSVVDKLNFGGSNPDFVKVLVEFFRNEISQESGYAKAEIYLDSGELDGNRYKAFSIPISELITTPDFTSTEIRVVRIFAYIAVDDGDGGFVGSEDHYLALDGLRLDNVSTQNPLYKMVGYSPTRTPSGTPVVKFDNTNNYVEFRFSLGVT